jgi:hypothetical protein
MDRRFRDRAPRAMVRNGDTFVVVEGNLEVSLNADVLLATDEKQRPVLDQSNGGRHEKTNARLQRIHRRLLPRRTQTPEAGWIATPERTD